MDRPMYNITVSSSNLSKYPIQVASSRNRCSLHRNYGKALHNFYALYNTGLNMNRIIINLVLVL